MLRNDQIQAAIIAKLKANNTIVALLDSSAEIKEDQYQGTEYNYPAVRVQLNSNEPDRRTTIRLKQIELLV